MDLPDRMMLLAVFALALAAYLNAKEANDRAHVLICALEYVAAPTAPLHCDTGTTDREGGE